MRVVLLLAALVAGASSFVYTCNEIKQFLAAGKEFKGETKACVVIPTDAALTEEPYVSYITSVYLLESDSGMKYSFKDLETDGHFCMSGLGPWFIESDNGADIECSSEKYKYAEIMLIFTSDEPNIVRASSTPVNTKYGKGTHVFVASDGALLIEKISIDDGKETTLQLYSGAGKSEEEERFALMPEKFVAGTSTVIIGPVTTLVIEDDVTVELTLTSFEEKQFISAQPGFSFSLMSTGRANDLQSSRPGILVSTAYGINDDSIAYDSLSITGTVNVSDDRDNPIIAADHSPFLAMGERMDDGVNTALSIECYKAGVGEVAATNITETRDVTINDDCTSLDITYQGNVAPENINRSSEVIYIRIDSNSDPVLKPVTTEAPTGQTDAPQPTGTVPTRRTPPPTTPTTTHSTTSASTSRQPSSTTTKTMTTTSSASGISIASLFIVSVLFI